MKIASPVREMIVVQERELAGEISLRRNDTEAAELR